MLLSPGHSCQQSLSSIHTSAPCTDGQKQNVVRRHKVWESRATQRPIPGQQKDRVVGAAQPALHVSLLVGSRHSCGQLGTGPKGQEPKEVGSISSCCLSPLAATAGSAAVAAPRQ